MAKVLSALWYTLHFLNQPLSFVQCGHAGNGQKGGEQCTARNLKGRILVAGGVTYELKNKPVVGKRRTFSDGYCKIHISMLAKEEK